MVASGAHDGTIAIWRVADGSAAGAIAGRGFAVNAIGFLPDGKTVATASTDETIRLWDLATGGELLNLSGHDGPVLALAIAADGSRLASGGVDGTVRLWRLGDGLALRTTSNHRRAVFALGLAPDGAWLVSSGADNAVRLWSMVDGGEIGTHQTRAAAEIDATDDRGAQIFRKCKACHALDRDGGRHAGPSLRGLFGRRAGTLADYPYSEALRRSDIVWTEETIDRLFDWGPDRLTPGSKMPLQRMNDPDERAELIRYLRRATAPN
jgi:cytochrome c